MDFGIFVCLFVWIFRCVSFDVKLLGELLLDRVNFHVMTKFISNPDFLKMMMILLRDKGSLYMYSFFRNEKEIPYLFVLWFRLMYVLWSFLNRACFLWLFDKKNFAQEKAFNMKPFMFLKYLLQIRTKLTVLSEYYWRTRKNLWIICLPFMQTKVCSVFFSLSCHFLS